MAKVKLSVIVYSFLKRVEQIKKRPQTKWNGFKLPGFGLKLCHGWCGTGEILEKMRMRGEPLIFVYLFSSVSYR